MWQSNQCNQMHASCTGSFTPLLSDLSNYSSPMSDWWYLQSGDLFLPTKKRRRTDIYTIKKKNRSLCNQCLMNNLSFFMFMDLNNSHTKYLKGAELQHFLSIYAARAHHSTSKLSHYTESHKLMITAFKFWLSASGKYKLKPGPGFGSWLVILHRHGTGKAVSVMTSLHLADEIKGISRAIETFTLRLVGKQSATDS